MSCGLIKNAFIYFKLTIRPKNINNNNNNSSSDNDVTAEERPSQLQKESETSSKQRSSRTKGVVNCFIFVSMFMNENSRWQSTE